MLKEEEVTLQPQCYKRHAEIEAHVSSGKFWRSILVTGFVFFGGIAVTQFNIANTNASIQIAANAKLTQMVEINTKRLDRLEDCLFIQPSITFKGNTHAIR